MTEPPGLALLRSRLDELAREALASCGRHKELEDRIVAMDVNLRDGHADTACQLVQGVGAERTELAQGLNAMHTQTAQRFAHIAQKIEALEPLTATGAQSRARAPQQEPAAASAVPEQPKPGRGSDPFSGGRDAWSRWHHGGGGGPGGPGGGGGPDGGDDDNAEHFEFSDLTHDRPGAGRKPLTKYCKSPFDTKAATLELPRFNGKTGR